MLIIAQMSIVQTVFSQKLDTSERFVCPSINKYAKTLDDFSPKNWRITDTVSGDLNKDGIDDFALVLSCKDSIKVNDGHDDGYKFPRILLLVFKVGDHYELKLQHNTLLEYENMNGSGYTGGFDGDPLNAIGISKGVLLIHFQWDITGAGTSIQYIVRYQSNDFYVIGATIERGYHADQSTYDVNYSTKRYTYDEIDDETGFGGEYSETHKKGKLSAYTLKKLIEIKDVGDMNSPGFDTF